MFKVLCLGFRVERVQDGAKKSLKCYVCKAQGSMVKFRIPDLRFRVQG